MLWAKNRLQKSRPRLFAEFIDLFPMGAKGRKFAEFLIFVAVGTFIGFYVAVPTNPQQAITAGFAWTSLFSVRKDSERKPEKRP